MNNELLPTITLNFYSDPGHGWLQVPKSLLTKHRVKVSCYSYKDIEFVYLEEDCDAPRFTTELEKFYRIVIKRFYLENHNSWIRNLNRIKFNKIA